jgi:hypothetical protein
MIDKFVALKTGVEWVYSSFINPFSVTKELRLKFGCQFCEFTKKKHLKNRIIFKFIFWKLTLLKIFVR